jgi:outer membrane receptor for ferrienterochelin and colicins
VNYFNYSNPIDNNNDNFTDVTLQERIFFKKWNFNRKNNKQLSLAGRLFYEDRWGGESGRKNIEVAMKCTEKAFTLNDGNY